MPWNGCAPQEVLLAILSWVDMRTLTTCAMLNRWWSSVAEDKDLWDVLCSRDFKGDYLSTVGLAHPRQVYKKLWGVATRVRSLSRGLDDKNAQSYQDIYRLCRDAPQTVLGTLSQLPDATLIPITKAIWGVQRLILFREWAQLARAPVQPREFLFRAMVLVNRLFCFEVTAEQIAAGIDALADEVRAYAQGPVTLFAMATVLFNKLRGNDVQYYDFRNSCIWSVLQRRVGIPISLSIVWILVAERLGLDLQPVGFPCHFLIRYVDADQLVYIDAFNRKFETLQDLHSVLTDEFEIDSAHHAACLEPMNPHCVMARVLRNLMKINSARHQLDVLMSLLEFDNLLEPTGRRNLLEDWLFEAHVLAVRREARDLFPG